MVLALSRYDACACAGPSEQPPEDPAVPVPDPCDEETAEAVPTVREPEDGAGPSWERRSIPYVLEEGRATFGRRFGVRGPHRLDVDADCEGGGSCVLGSDWWRGPGAYVFWVADPEDGKDVAEVALVGDELEIAFRRSYRRLLMAHPIEGVELRPIEGPRPVLTLVNRTDRTFEVVHFNGTPLFDLVRADPDGWAGSREGPTLGWCGFGLTTIAARSSVPLGSIAHGLRALEGSLDAQTVVVSLYEPLDDDVEAMRGTREGVWVQHVPVVTTPLPPELIRARERRHERMARRAARRRPASP